MTTRKTYHGREEPVTFGKPTIGPRVYLATGPSGWPEAFDRKRADAELAKFLHPITPDELVEPFIEAMRLEGAKAYSWSDVMNYIAKITQIDWKLIPPAIGVAFWAHVIEFKE